MVVSDEQGNYKSGVKAGLVAVSPSSLYNFDNENWPTDFYVEPEVDSILVAEGQTVTSNFTFKPYSCFVIGKCSADNVALAGVEISGISFNMTTFTLLFYHTISAQNGYYRLGVMPGTLTSLTAYKDGYELTSPVGGYFQINVAQGETVSGKNFTFSPLSVVASIAGSVTFNDGSPATNVYVAAENLAVESPAGFLIAYTDGSGNFSIDNVQNGSYKLGVYRSGHASDPEMRYFPIMGAPVTGQDFVLSPGSGVDSHDKSVLPRKIKLAQNFPNPFNPSTTISFALPSASDVNITIFNASAQKIRTLVDRYCSAGQHQVVWDGRNEAGEKVASGLYLYQLKSNSYNKVMKMILAK